MDNIPCATSACSSGASAKGANCSAASASNCGPASSVSGAGGANCSGTGVINCGAASTVCPSSICSGVAIITGVKPPRSMPSDTGAIGSPEGVSPSIPTAGVSSSIKPMSCGIRSAMTSGGSISANSGITSSNCSSVKVVKSGAASAAVGLQPFMLINAPCIAAPCKSPPATIAAATLLATPVAMRCAITP